jgi:hypothetical protein
MLNRPRKDTFSEIKCKFRSEGGGVWGGYLKKPSERSSRARMSNKHWRAMFLHLLSPCAPALSKENNLL